MQKIIIWDNDGTIMGSADPNDLSNKSKVILPNVKEVMQRATINVICSGCKTPQSELQNFDPEKILAKFKKLMLDLPISIATFSPSIGGTECWVVIKHSDKFEIYKAHEDNRYQHLIGRFKKPDTGMLTVIKDLLHEKNIGCDDTNAVFVGDTWQDMKAAHDAMISYLHAEHIHGMNDEDCWQHTIHWHDGKKFGS